MAQCVYHHNLGVIGVASDSRGSYLAKREPFGVPPTHLHLRDLAFHA